MALVPAKKLSSAEIEELQKSGIDPFKSPEERDREAMESMRAAARAHFRTEIGAPER